MLEPHINLIPPQTTNECLAGKSTIFFIGDDHHIDATFMLGIFQRSSFGRGFTQGIATQVAGWLGTLGWQVWDWS